MTRIQRVQLTCTAGRIISRAAMIIGAVPAGLALICISLYFVGQTLLENGNREWNDMHGIENPQEPITAVAEAEKLAKAWGVQS